MREQLKKVIESTVSHRPMTHCITNPVTVNDCANIILAAGGTAIMAQDEREVEEITAHAQSLVLNMGAVRAQEAMLRAARTAKKLGHPVILDPGRRRCKPPARRYVRPAARGGPDFGHPRQRIRGAALAAGAGQESGVEADLHDQINEHNLAESAAWLRDFARPHRHSGSADRRDRCYYRWKTHCGTFRRQRAAPPHYRRGVHAHLAHRRVLRRGSR